MSLAYWLRELEQQQLRREAEASVQLDEGDVHTCYAGHDCGAEDEEE